MTWWERWSFNTLHVTVAATGVVYFWMKYLLATDDPFAIVNHPWEPAMLTAHVIAAPFFIAFFGMVFRSHTFRKLYSPDPANRWTGWTSLVSFSIMAFSGYLIQAVTSALLLSVAIWTHVAASVVFLLGYTSHWLNGWRINRLPSGTRSVGAPAQVST
ncbi:MAG: hypothetical protein F4Z04_10380 [Acidobacteria bacterium]|nr:hypothetical protein [Acidobacteriota bacterium]